MIDLFALGVSEANDPSSFVPVDKRNVVERVALRDEPDHSGFVVLVPDIDPYECFFPDELPGEGQGQTVPSAVQFVLGGVKVDQYTIL